MATDIYRMFSVCARSGVGTCTLHFDTEEGAEEFVALWRGQWSPTTRFIKQGWVEVTTRRRSAKRRIEPEIKESLDSVLAQLLESYMAKIKWNDVESSAIAAVGYHDETLYVKFTSGRQYYYPKCPRQKFNAILGADRSKDGSVGRTFNLQVRAAAEGFELPTADHVWER